MDALGRRLERIAKISRTRGIIYWRAGNGNMKHARAISLGEYSSYVIKAFIN